ncbi:glycoside hydrolase family 127 protein [Aquipuribacter sp. SD81]|uniref:glycoside hydrolase family 127 protein n=1 Tax=Aquipuribacter sp. SD81 TaxID=3127703 RepID=UPI0030189484
MLTDGFWAERQRVNGYATLAHCFAWLERLGWLDNFDRVLTGTTGGYRPGWQFSDSEVYKLMEALAWEHARTGDPDAEAMLLRLTVRVAAAQDDDGYLNTCFGHDGQDPRWSDLEKGHELYCAGHLFQAAVARARTAPEDELVRVARRLADHVCREFGSSGRDGICGHPEVELGLAELGRALKERRYVEQALLFVERRGHGRLGAIPLLGPQYFQDDLPVREADVWRGHAVRALYLGAAAVDVAVDLGDDDLLDAVRRQWDRTVERRTYITGGMGSRHQDEGFGEDWELPPDRAYCETCAGVASVMVSWRLWLATGDVRYVDLMERTLFNVVATSPRSDGRAFFYANPLQQRVAGSDVDQDTENPRAEGGTRAPWFDVSCCPTNVARTLASWQAYAVGVEQTPGGGDVVTLLQYAGAEVRVGLTGGGHLALRVRTRYPVEGEVDVEVVEAPDRPVTVRLRVPHWAEGARLVTPQGEGEAPPGWADVTRRFAVGERIRLLLPVAPRFTWPDPRVDAVRGCVAVEAGPLVLCVESTDLPAGVDVEEVRVDPAGRVRPVGAGRARAAGAVVPAPEPAEGGRPPFGPRPPADSGRPFELPLVPYHSWAERAPTTMRVWLPTT